ncbi:MULTISPECIES: YecA/YgfB family protein [Citrobacter]|uniref:YecA/YgfB family protein n=1 Tax=Citrobacter TaxID=544 RepID=UPI0015E91441|nr:SEC-C metal-binding domain-containing protein [Citrobacter sp. RHB36-C18]QMD05994.1 SEC-C domain-containing protein [Citrobacter sp. RHB36-C18]HEM8612764.1 SEC-C domain-containing protein [Citrobacter amalonaticus]
MLKVIKKGQGINKTEKRLIELANNAFIGLWSYPNVYSDEGYSKNKSGKEVCDLLVVFENNVIIFSDKDIKFHEGIDISVAWKRWFKRSVTESATQLYGAEKFLKETKGRLFLDKECKHPFPIEIEKNMRFFLVAVTSNSTAPASKYYGRIAEGSSGTFMNIFLSDVKETLELPFSVGDINPNKTFVHVLDEVSLQLLLTELDTISDFVAYLKEKERVIRSGYLGLSPGEDDTLGAYLSGHGEIVDEKIVPDNTFVQIAEHEWEGLKKSSKYNYYKALKKGSVFWDETIQRFSDSILNATVGLGMENDFLSHEETVRQLASESRRSRYYLSHAFLDKFKQVPTNRRSSRIVQSIDEEGKFYIFLFFPKDEFLSYEKYRMERFSCIQMYALAAKYKYNEIKKLIIIATESKDSDGRSEDVVYCKFDKPLTKEERVLAKIAMKDYNVLTDFIPKPIDSFQISPIVNNEKKIGRNDPCYCGSGKKFKKCHG